MRKLLVLLAAVAFVVAYTVPAIADGWSFYGHSRMSTFMDSKSKEVKGGTGFDDDDLTWNLQGNARIGATVKANAVGGGFEYGTGINLRKLYGTWNFGGGTLLVGQTYTPVTTLWSDQVWGDDLGLLGWGMPYAGRQPQISLTMGGLKVALLKPIAPAKADAIITGIADIDTTLPKIEVSYDFKAGPAGVGVFGGMNTYDEVDATDKDESIDSNVMGVRVSMAFGAAYVKVGGYVGANLGTYGFSGGGKPTYTTKLNDSDNMGYFLVAGFKASDTISVQAGYGYSEREVDVAGSETDDGSAYYVQAKIDFAKNVWIVPEIGKFDYLDNAAGKAEGDLTYFGAKWEIRF